MDVIRKSCNISGFNSYTTYLIGMLCFFLVITLQTQAQNNPYKIDDACYKYMRKINTVVDKPFALNMCDTLRAMAKSKHDLKAECISLNQRSIHYMQLKDLKLVKEFPKYKAFIEKTPYLQYLYATWNNLANIYELRGDYKMCLQTIEEMRNDAIQRNNNYGLASAYKKLGGTYFNLADYKSALDNYKKAYELLNETHDKNIYAIEVRMASCYDYLGNLNMAIKMIKQGIAHTPAAYETSSLIFYLMIIEHNSDSFSNKELEDVIKKIEHLGVYRSLRSTSDNYNATVSRFYAKKKMYAQALLYTDKIFSERTKSRCKLYIFGEEGRWDSAYIYSMLNSDYIKKEWQNKNSELLAQSSASIDSSRLALDNKQMLINQLTEHRRMLEMQDQQNKLTIQKNLLAIKNGDLELANRDHEYQAQKQLMSLQKSASQINELKLQQELQRNKDLEKQRNVEASRSYMILGTLLFLLLLSIYIVRITTKSKRRVLKEKEIAIKAKADEQEQKTIALNALNEAEKAREHAEESRKEAEVARQQAEQANNLKTMFLQNMSHEIRTPLNAIVGFSEILTTPEIAESMEEGERNEMSRMIQENSDLLLTLVNDILDVSKLQSGTYNLALSEVDANELCNISLLSIKGREQTGVSLELRLPQTSVAFRTDKQRMQQVLINFLTNACKNTPTGKITLGYEPVSISDKSYLRFFVEDTGCGIPKDKIDSIFNRFEKLDDFKQGTGLGLNICRLISKLVKGNIYVDPNYTNGARFVFEHPLTMQ